MFSFNVREETHACFGVLYVIPGGLACAPSYKLSYSIIPLL